MKQEYIIMDSYNSYTSQDLSYGELGEIIEDTCYKGLVITRTYQGFVCVYSPNEKEKAFKTTWCKELNTSIRKLINNEKIVLSNG